MPLLQGGLDQLLEGLIGRLHQSHGMQHIFPRIWTGQQAPKVADVLARRELINPMAAIFGNVRRVLVWLGLDTDDSRAAFAFLSEAYSLGPSKRKRLMDDSRWTAVQRLCENAYWGRVWIVQEICMAAHITILCGRQQVPWQYISHLRTTRMHVWPEYQSLGERAFMRSLPARIDHQKEMKQKKGCILWTLLENFKHSNCQEVHDKVYGFLGLSTDCTGDGLEIDYTKIVDELYRDIILFYFETFRHDKL
jgi:hypothetical protein